MIAPNPFFLLTSPSSLQPLPGSISIPPFPESSIVVYPNPIFYSPSLPLFFLFHCVLDGTPLPPPLSQTFSPCLPTHFLAGMTLSYSPSPPPFHVVRGLTAISRLPAPNGMKRGNLIPPFLIGLGGSRRRRPPRSTPCYCGTTTSVKLWGTGCAKNLSKVLLSPPPLPLFMGHGMGRPTETTIVIPRRFCSLRCSSEKEFHQLKVVPQCSNKRPPKLICSCSCPPPPMIYG